MITETKQLNLSPQRGFPMYFICERKKSELKTRITFADVIKHNDLIDNEVYVWGKKYLVKAINEIRPSGQNYGVSDTVWWHDITADFIPQDEPNNNK